MISQTITRFGTAIRKVGGIQYNHASICLDLSGKQFYAFGRPQHNAVLLGRLVSESVVRYTLRTNKFIPVIILRVPVSAESYSWIKSTIHLMKDNRDYMYNLFSVLSYPVTKGFKTYKAFSCIEFIAYLLEKSGYELKKPCYQYKPDDLLLLNFKIIYQGDIRGFLTEKEKDTTYFAPVTKELVGASIKAFIRICFRMLHRDYSYMI